MAAIVIAPVRSDQWLALSLVGIQFAQSRELGQAFKTWRDLKQQWTKFEWFPNLIKINLTRDQTLVKNLIQP